MREKNRKDEMPSGIYAHLNECPLQTKVIHISNLGSVTRGSAVGVRASRFKCERNQTSFIAMLKIESERCLLVSKLMRLWCGVGHGP